MEKIIALSEGAHFDPRSSTLEPARDAGGIELRAVAERGWKRIDRTYGIAPAPGFNAIIRSNSGVYYDAVLEED